jgi:hypothetical protein
MARLRGSAGAVRSLFRGTGPFSWIAIGFVIVGILFLASILLTPGAWQWWMTAKAVHGSEQNGIVYYTYHGRKYTVDDVGSVRSGPRTVYVNPSKPADAEVTVTGTRILDWTVTGGPLLVAAGFLTWGFTHKNRNRRRRAAASSHGSSYGSGLDRDAVRQLLAQQKASGRQGTSPPTGNQNR